MKHLLTALVLSSLVACGGNSSAPEGAASPETSPTPPAAAAGSRPSCEAIDDACDPHEEEGGLAKECHDLAEASATSEAACAARKDECLAACPPPAAKQ